MSKIQGNERLLEAKEQNRILIAAHRGTCGGNIIQNTCMAYENALQHGADMIEIDAIQSTDGDFFACHNGQELRVIGVSKDIRSMSTAEIESYACINQLGQPVNQHLERLDMILDRFRGRCLINIDRSWFYWKETIAFLDAQKMQDQILLKSPVTRDLLQTLQESGSHVMYMPIVKNMEDWDIVREYDVNLVAAELIFEDLSSPLITPEFIAKLHGEGILTWVNTITLDDKIKLSGGLDDDHAIRNGYDKNWGTLIHMGFDILQTDWPALLKKYVLENKQIKGGF